MQLNASLDMTNEALAFRLEFVKAHDSLTEDYYRLRFGECLTVYVTNKQLDALIMRLREGGQ